MSVVGLHCCVPTAYSPTSRTLVHSPVCTFNPGAALSRVEYETWVNARHARRAAELQATASQHPTAPGEPWFAEHDRLAALGQCPDWLCQRCDHIGRDREADLV